jgi:Major tropism determinant N-terminal domain/Collagen triple helix repeat (20 copies)
MACPANNVRFQLRNGTTAQWNANPILSKGEPGYDTDLHILKVGNGITPWANLPSTGTGEVGPIGPLGPVGPLGPAGPVGPRGPGGEIGPVGNTGNWGSTGPSGPTTHDGITGPSGPTGATGPMAPAFVFDCGSPTRPSPPFIGAMDCGFVS